MSQGLVAVIVSVGIWYKKTTTYLCWKVIWTFPVHAFLLCELSKYLKAHFGPCETLYFSLLSFTSIYFLSLLLMELLQITSIYFYVLDVVFELQFSSNIYICTSGCLPIGWCLPFFWQTSQLHLRVKLSYFTVFLNILFHIFCKTYGEMKFYTQCILQITYFVLNYCF